MLFDLGQRLHKLIYGSFYQSDRKRAIELAGQVQSLLKQHGLETDQDREVLIEKLASEVSFTLSLGLSHRAELTRFIRDLFDYEVLFVWPAIDFEEPRTTSELWHLREALQADYDLLQDFDQAIEAITDYLTVAYGALVKNLGNASSPQDLKEGVTVETNRIDRITEIGSVVETMAAGTFEEDIQKLKLFARLRERLGENLIAASGGNPNHPQKFTRAFKLPSKTEFKRPADLVETYLDGTPLKSLFEGAEPFTIPLASRFEHHHIIAGSGHGKTQTLQTLIAHDLEAVADGRRSIIVIDSQGDLIDKIASLKAFAPGEPLHDKLCLIDPTDIEYPVSLNLFDVGLERLQSYPMLERERLTNSILELYDFVLGSLLSAEMTQKQSVIFRYVTRLMLHIPDATIHTLRELLEKDGEKRFASSIAKLEGTARHFFATEFGSREFVHTRSQVLRRLWGILENQTFERMFSHPQSKLDLFSEMNSGKVILINTAKDLLKESGTEIFGRFFIAMIAQAAQERATLPTNKRMPTLVYIDEAADYFDRNIGIILSQARKYKVGMVLAHQYLGQLDSKLQDAFSANTAIKFAGGFTGKDARAAAQLLNCDPTLIERQPKGSFAAFIRGMTPSALPLKFAFGVLEGQPQMTKTERQAVRNKMRERYAVHYSELTSIRTGESRSQGKGNQSGKVEPLKPKTDPDRPDDPDNPDTSSAPKW